MTVFGAGFAATSEHSRVVVTRRLHSQPLDGLILGKQEVTDFHKVSRAEGPKRTDGMRRPVSAGCDTLPMFDVLEAQ
jgi:hypothetical protein